MDQDRELLCVQCGQAFTFTSGEQGFYSQNSLQEPKRCKNCRGTRKNGPPARPQGRGAQQPTERAAEAPRGAPRRGPQPWRPAAPDDPNGYRSPGFQDFQQRDRFQPLDQDGLPRDDDEADGQLAMLGPARRDGAPAPAPAAPRPARPNPGNGMPRGMNGRRPDRAGTDPDAYRSPGFRGEAAPATARSAPSRRERRAQRPRFETTCAECGAPAQVPFQPGPDRPAFCKPCYQIKKPLLGLGPGRTPNLGSTDEPEAVPAEEPSLPAASAE